LNRTNSRDFDSIDLQIIRIIDEQFNKKNYSPSTKQISEILEKSKNFPERIPPRTIRYRISKLEEKRILQKKIPITHERKLGIGENIIIVEENPKMREKFHDIINKNTAIDICIPTYGKYNGYYLHSTYCLDSSYTPHKISQLLLKKKIIKEYFIFDLLDYKVFGWNFDYFDEKGNWCWKWEIWKEHLLKEIKNSNELEIKFDTKAKRIDFDFTDIQILRNMYSLENVTLKKLAENLELSITQIGRRIKKMEEKGIIRGYKTGFFPFTNFIPLFILIDADKNTEQIFYHLSKIPYPLTIAIDNKEKIGVVIEFPQYEISDFLKAFYFLKPLLKTIKIQFWSENPDINIADNYNFFDEITNTFTKINEEHERTIRELEK
jgi:DNA-binding Lrp family transcriptional regulator